VIEPFAGGVTVFASVVVEDFVLEAVWVERDRDVTAFWWVTLGSGAIVTEWIYSFESTCENFYVLEASQSRNVAEHGFRAFSCHLRCGRIGRVEDDVGIALVKAFEH